MEESSRECLEHKTIRTNLTDITQLISSDPSAGPTWFAQKLEEKAFIASAASAVVVGYSKYEQTSALMKAMVSKIQASQEPKKEFAEFIEILRSNPPLEGLAKKLVQECATIQQVVGSDEPCSGGSDQNKVKSEDKMFQMQKEDFPVKGRRYDSGCKPAITALGRTLVEVHEHPDRDNANMYYNLFEVGNGGEFNTVVIGKKYDTGFSPTIAALPESNMIVEIHSHDNNLYYSVGHLDGSKINWSPKGVRYDRGVTPAVAVTKSNVVVEVHGDSGNLYHRVGRLDVGAARIQWKGSNGHYYDKGAEPSLSINDENQVIEIHQPQKSGDELYYSIGRLDPDNLTLTWLSKGNKYDTGCNVSVIVDSMGLVFEVHSGGNDNLYYRFGTLKDNYIAWYGKGGTKYDTGDQPSLTYVPGAHAVVAECHIGHKSHTLFQTSMKFKVDLVDMTFGTAVKSV